MVFPNKRRGTSGLTLVECLAIIAIIIIIWYGFLFYLTATSPRKGQRPACLRNLKQIGAAHLRFANDHDGKFPAQTPANEGGSKEWAGTPKVFRHFLVLSNELGDPKVLMCPSDYDRVCATNFGNLRTTNLSYWVDLNAQNGSSQSLLMGDRNLMLGGDYLTNGCYWIASAAPLNWSHHLHNMAGNLGLGDGSVIKAGNLTLTKQRLQQPIPRNWLAIP